MRIIGLLVISLLLTLTLVNEYQRVDAQKQSRSSSNREQKGYLYSDSNNASFIQLTKAGRRIRGQMQIFYIKDAQAGLVESDSVSFEGIFDGGNITLMMNRDGTPSWLSSGKTITGMLIPGKLTLVSPASDGTLNSVAYFSATVEDYNKAVLTLRKQAAMVRSRYLKAKAKADRIAAEQRAVVDAHNEVIHTAESLSHAVRELPDAEWYDDALRSYDETWQRMKEAHTELLAESKKTLTSSQIGTVQSKLGTLQSRLGSIESRRGSFESRLSSANMRIREAEEDLGRLQSAFAQLQRAVDANTTGEPRATITAEHISKAVAFARSEINKAVTARDAAKNQAAAYDNQAADLYQEAEAFVKTLKPVGR